MTGTGAELISKVQRGRSEDFLLFTVLLKATYKPWVRMPTTNPLLFMNPYALKVKLPL